jgi:hypothetical protein
MSPTTSEPNRKASKHSACCLLHAGFFLGLFFTPADEGDIPPKMMTFTGLHDDISQKMELLITTAVRM